MKLLLLAVLAAPTAVALVAEGTPPPLSPPEVPACEEQGGCAYVSRAWVAARVAEAREQGRREAKTQCGERTGILLPASGGQLDNLRRFD